MNLKQLLKKIQENRSCIRCRNFLLNCDSLEDLSAHKSAIRLFVLNSVVMLLIIPLGLYGSRQDPGDHFGEGGLMTWISVFMLLATSYFTREIWLRRSNNHHFNWKSPVAIWKLVSIGFLFLA